MPTIRHELVDLLRGPDSTAPRLPNGLRSLKPEELPPMARHLLVHERDMTSTLQAFYGRSLHLRLLESQIDRDTLTRQVVLETDGHNRPVEFGAIRIHLDRFPSEPRRVVEAGQIPLGAVLEYYHLTYSCRPQSYFETIDGALADPLFGTPDRGPLYGRWNRIRGHGEHLLAEVIEVLAPWPTGPEGPAGVYGNR